MKVKKFSCKNTPRLGAQFQIHLCYMKSFKREQVLEVGFSPTMPPPPAQRISGHLGRVQGYKHMVLKGKVTTTKSLTKVVT